VVLLKRVCILKSESGEQFGSFKLLYSCGKGSYGEVFLARSVITGKVFALKKLYLSGELPGVIEYQQICPQTGLMQIYYTGQEGDEFYYVMDAADDLNGGDGDYLPDTLLNRMKRSGRIPPEELRETASSLINACSILHRKGVMHRDIKPGNVLFINGRALPGDIGLAAGDSGNTLVGSSGFISPEVVAGVTNHNLCDIFYTLTKMFVYKLLLRVSQNSGHYQLLKTKKGKIMKKSNCLRQFLLFSPCFLLFLPMIPA